VDALRGAEPDADTIVWRDAPGTATTPILDLDKID
jgi:hypothetical protein